MVHSYLQSFANVYLLNIKWHVAAKTRCNRRSKWRWMDAECSELCVCSNNCSSSTYRWLYCVFIVNHKLRLWHVTRRYFCSLNEKLSSQAGYFSFNQRWVAACWMAWRKNGICSLHSLQRWALCSNRPANVQVSVKRVEVVERS